MVVGMSGKISRFNFRTCSANFPIARGWCVWIISGLIFLFVKGIMGIRADMFLQTDWAGNTVTIFSVDITGKDGDI
jgi:hypothetical protein